MLTRVGLAAAAIAAVLLPLRKAREREATPVADVRGARLQELSQQLTDAQVRWTATAERDSALAMLERSGSLDTTPPVRLGGFPGEVRPSKAEASVRKYWRLIGLADSTVSVAVFVYNQASYVDHAWRATYAGDLITTRDGITWCIAIVPGEIQKGGVFVSGDRLDRALGPCVLLSAFGPPGAGVRAWLDATHYGSARSNLWLGTSSGYLDGNGSSPWAWLYDPTARYATQIEGFSLIRSLGGQPFAELLAPPYWYGAPGIRCLDGDAAACEESVLHSAVMRAPDSGFPAHLTRPGLSRVPGVTLATPRPPAEFFVSDLIRDQGRERFSAFWKSDQPFDRAFATAFGEPLGRWTARWARRQWEGSWEARHGGASIILGANLSTSWPIVVLGWSLLALGAAASAAKRRQVL